MAAGLGFQHQREGGIAADIDPLDRVHLDGDIQGHGRLSKVPGANLWLTNSCNGAEGSRRGRFGISAVAPFRLSIAAKLYAIFALLATVTVAMALVAVTSARRHAALTDEFRASFDGARQLERVNALVHAGDLGIARL